MNNIKEFRTKLNLTQTQLAEILGVSFVTVNRWENGHTSPSKLALARLKEMKEKHATKEDCLRGHKTWRAIEELGEV